MDEELKEVYRYALRGYVIKDKIYSRCEGISSESRFIKIYAYRNDQWRAIATLSPYSGPSLNKTVDIMKGMWNGTGQ